ncbi:MAG: aldose 1-epimerase family protein [Ruminococcaceae bacterium]|nr:aldose 1-epimerase family protein [Oscillospiraceae bacterium]
MIKINNGTISLSVEERGAQMRSLCDISANREYLWQADPEVWSRSAPVLFPAVGKMHTDGYIYKNERYPMPKHGFARDVLFEVEEKSESTLTLAYTPDENVKAMYPFDLVFRARFALKGRTLSFSYEVENKGEETMYFSLGAHPGFFCEFGDKIVFEKEENVTALFFNEADRPNENAAPVTLNGKSELTLTREFFESGSLCFPAVASEGVRLERDGKAYMKMHFGKVPHLWLWAKPHANFVCIEPWHGADECVPVETLKDKKGIISLEAGKTFVFPITVEI